MNAAAAVAALIGMPLFDPADQRDFVDREVADWPDDIKYLCEALITGPGTMINVERMNFALKRVDAYPTKLEGAVQHNAWWDAMALRDLLENRLPLEEH